VRWRPVLSTHSPSVSESSASLVAACWEKLLALLPWCSVSNPPLSLVSFRTPYSWDILRGRSIATRDTHSDEYWSADEISSESGQNRCFLNTSAQHTALQTSAPWQLNCFESRQKERSRTNSPGQRFQSQLFWKIVRYFCRTLYKVLAPGIFVPPLQGYVMGLSR